MMFRWVLCPRDKRVLMGDVRINGRTNWQESHKTQCGVIQRCDVKQLHFGEEELYDSWLHEFCCLVSQVWIVPQLKYKIPVASYNPGSKGVLS